MRIKAYARAAATLLMRRASPVRFDDPSRTEPLSRGYGYERGVAIDRHYIEAFLKRRADRIRGDVVEIAETRYASQFAQHVTSKTVLVPSADIAVTSGADAIVVGDLTNPETLPEAAFDTFVCTQTLNFIYDVHQAVRSAHRLLRPGGAFLGTVAGVCQLSTYDADRWGDYWRFMPMGLERLLAEAFERPADVSVFGNVFAAKCYMDGVVVEDLPDRRVLDRTDAEFPIVIGFEVMK